MNCEYDLELHIVLMPHSACSNWPLQSLDMSGTYESISYQFNGSKRFEVNAGYPL